MACAVPGAGSGKPALLPLKPPVDFLASFFVEEGASGMLGSMIASLDLLCDSYAAAVLFTRVLVEWPSRSLSHEPR